MRIDQRRIPAAVAVVALAAASAWAIRGAPGVSDPEAFAGGLLYMAMAGWGFVWIAKGGNERWGP